MGQYLSGIFILAFVSRLFFIHHFPFALSGDFIWNDATAWNLCRGHGFTIRPDGFLPSIYRTPGYPAFLATIYKVCGHSLAAARMGNCVIDSLTAVLAVIAGSKLLGRVGIFGGALYALSPYAGIYCSVIGQDILLTFMVMTTLCFTIWAVEDPELRRWIAVGILIGLTAWVKPFMVLYGIVPVLGVLSTTLSRSRKLRAVVAMIVVSSAVFLPWEIRNYRVFGTLAPAVGGTGSNLGLVLMESEGKEAVDGAPSEDRLGFERSFVDGRPLIEKQHALEQLYLPQIAAHWPGFLRMCVYHIPRLWVSARATGWTSIVGLFAPIIGGLVLSFGAIGMWLVRNARRKLLLLYATIFAVTLMYIPYSVAVRYTLPARPVMLLFVAVAIARFAKYFWNEVAGGWRTSASDA